MPIDTTSVINTAIVNLPGIIAIIKGDHAIRNPGAPLLTDEQVKAGLLSAIGSSLTQDEQWLAAHPQG
jgi:hypothetical protein